MSGHASFVVTALCTGEGRVGVSHCVVSRHCRSVGSSCERGDPEHGAMRKGSDSADGSGGE